MTKKEIFIQEIGDCINNNDIQLSSEAIEYFEDYLKFDLPDEEKKNIEDIISRISN